MKQRFSFGALVRGAAGGHRHWQPQWRTPAMKRRYQVIVVGAGGHGLATAYYLAKNHGITDVAVIEKGWLGGGNTGRNTMVVRSNYLFPESTAIYDLALRLYEDLSRDLNYNIMLSQRGIVTLAHSRAELDGMARWATALQVNGIDSEIVDRDGVRRLVPTLKVADDARYPVVGGFLQRRGGIARHDAVAWGYARGADSYGVDIIQNCEVRDLIVRAGRIAGVETAQGVVEADSVALTVAGHSSVLAAKAGFRLPVTSYALQAFVSEPIKPILNTVVLSPVTGFYVSQSDKGELVMGGALDLYNSYAQRGNFPAIEGVLSSAVEMFPFMSRLKLMRHWGGIVDVVPDSSPIIGKSPVQGLYLNCGWGTGGFKAIPAGGFTLAHSIAHDTPHPIAAPFALDRFATGALIDEAGASGIAH
ncbi:MAG: sarcosine oxidase subunit beta family protein [Betaproteobacteria bacterium]|nr:sarcosine oxidase subunit beta family protein [Betaproteobacteria bacterium]MBK9607531.1 sarcosine oxidase subunit beta family protein [Betaproteobacteria bacterium]